MGNTKQEITGVKHTNMKQEELFENEGPFIYKYDYERLKTGMARVFQFMKGNDWKTLKEISNVTNVPEASASAHLRDFRKAKYGLHIVDRRIRGDRSKGLWEYKLTVNNNET